MFSWEQTLFTPILSFSELRFGVSILSVPRLPFPSLLESHSTRGARTVELSGLLLVLESALCWPGQLLHSQKILAAFSLAFCSTRSSVSSPDIIYIYSSRGVSHLRTSLVRTPSLPIGEDRERKDWVVLAYFLSSSKLNLTVIILPALCRRGKVSFLHSQSLHQEPFPGTAPPRTPFGVSIFTLSPEDSSLGLQHIQIVWRSAGVPNHFPRFDLPHTCGFPLPFHSDCLSKQYALVILNFYSVGKTHSFQNMSLRPTAIQDLEYVENKTKNLAL